jgi:hypothetical protein
VATPTSIMASVASLMNDTARNVFTDAAVLPYLNIALNDLQELFELNNIPVTNEVSATLAVTAGTTVIGPTTLPTGLIEIRSLFERPTGSNNTFIEMSRREFLPQSNVVSNYFGVFAWVDNEIRLLEANTNIDLRLEYVKSIFATPILIGGVSVDLGIIGTQQYLIFRTASLCAEFISENKTRAQSLDGYAADALSRALSIPTKSKQSIQVRRRPFRSGYKSRNYLWW